MIKILLVEKNLIISNTLKESFNQDKQLNLVGICKEGNEAIEFLNTNAIDVLLMDPNQTNGMVATAQIHKEFPDVRIIGFSDSNEKESSSQMVSLGAYKHLSKFHTDVNELITEIKECYVGNE